MSEFACPACGSPAVAYPPTLEDHAPVVCARCAASVGSLGEFRRRLERMLENPRAAGASGC
jgi:hypothetical protein